MDDNKEIKETTETPKEEEKRFDDSLGFMRDFFGFGSFERSEDEKIRVEIEKEKEHIDF